MGGFVLSHCKSCTHMHPIEKPGNLSKRSESGTAKKMERTGSFISPPHPTSVLPRLLFRILILSALARDVVYLQFDLDLGGYPD